MDSNDGTWTASTSRNSLQNSPACMVYSINISIGDTIRRLVLICWTGFQKSQLFPEMLDFHGFSWIFTIWGPKRDNFWLISTMVVPNRIPIIKTQLIGITSQQISTMDIPKLDPIKCHQFYQLTPMFVVYIMWYTHGNHETTAPQSNQAT